MISSTEDVQEVPQSQNVAYHQRHQEEEQTNYDRQYTNYKLKKTKAMQSAPSSLPSIHAISYGLTLQKHGYTNILEISPPKNSRFFR